MSRLRDALSLLARLRALPAGIWRAIGQAAGWARPSSRRPGVEQAGAPLVRVLQTVGHALDVPPDLPLGHAVVVAQSGNPQWLALGCPCGTGHPLLVNLSSERSPRWRMTTDREGLVTIYPSIDAESTAGRCHFVLRDGHVSWIQPPTSPIGKRHLDEPVT